MILKDERQRN